LIFTANVTTSTHHLVELALAAPANLADRSRIRRYALVLERAANGSA